MHSPASMAGPPDDSAGTDTTTRETPASGYQDVPGTYSPDAAGLQGSGDTTNDQRGKGGPDQVLLRLFRHQRRGGHRRHNGCKYQQHSLESRKYPNEERARLLGFVAYLVAILGWSQAVSCRFAGE